MEVQIRCTGSGMMPLNQIIPLQGGLKDLSDANYRKLKNQILTHGMVSPFMIWEGRCIDGHQRLRTLLKMKEEGILMPESFPKVDIEAPDMKSAKRILLAISSQYGKLTGDGLYEYMQDMEIDIPEMKESFEFDSLDFGDFEKEYFDETPGYDPTEDNIPEDAPTISKLGDIWHLGNHKIMCGDSTLMENMKMLMGEEKADMVFTDPPYNIGSDSKNYAKDKSKAMKEISEADWDKDFNIIPFMKLLPDITKESATYYLFTSQFLISDIWKEMNEFCDFSGYLIWAKPNPMPSLSKRHPTWNTELCAYGTRGTKRIVNFPSEGHFLSCREVIKKSDGSHPTQKPIELLEPLISFSSGKGQMIFDGFLGSGSTLIACEKTNRKLYGCEIDPHYVDVAVKRFADFTHQSDNIYLEREGEKIPYSTLVDLNPIL